MGAVPVRRYFRRAALAADGFVGWVPFQRVLSDDEVPRVAGVYVVSRSASGPPVFLANSPAGRFKGKDPTVSKDALTANWVPDASIVYIGKADELRRRLRQFADFGAGKPVGHWGGRLIWQLFDSQTLLVAWKPTPGQVPREVEASLIAQFRVEHGKAPFANNPHRPSA